MRLDGPALEHAKGFNIVSDGIAPGSIQVPGNGLPIVLLADRQTTGGYPKIATVIAADLPALGRLAPGAKVAFEAVSIAEAEAEHRARGRAGRRCPDRSLPVRGERRPSTRRVAGLQSRQRRRQRARLAIASRLATEQTA